MSFLQWFRGCGIHSNKTLQSSEKEAVINRVTQLDVDVFQTERSIVIYAQAAGSDMNDVNVSIEGDTDIIIIEGQRIRPEFIVFPKNQAVGSFFTEECAWGDFYRRIILPESIEIKKAEAKIKNGVLILILPLLQLEEKEKVGQK